MKHLHVVTHNVFICNSKILKNPKCPPTEDCVNILSYINIMENNTAIKKEDEDL